MKVGDLVRLGAHIHSVRRNEVGVVINTIYKKCWRTSVQGKVIDWNKAKPELHGIILFPNSIGTISMPAIDLEVLNEMAV